MQCERRLPLIISSPLLDLQLSLKEKKALIGKSDPLNP